MIKSDYTEIWFADAKRDFKDFLSYSLHGKIYLLGNENIIEWFSFFQKLFSPLYIERANSYDDVKSNKITLFILSSSANNLFQEIKKIKVNPYIPILIIKNEEDNAFIDHCYENGADIVISKNALFDAKGKLNLMNSTELIISLHKLLAKFYYLKWFWYNIQKVKKLAKEAYPKDDESSVSEIKKKLDIAYGHLLKPHSNFHHSFEKSNEEFAFLSFWACLNNIIKDPKNGEILLLNKKSWYLIGKSYYEEGIKKELTLEVKSSKEEGYKVIEKKNIKNDLYPTTFVPICFWLKDKLKNINDKSFFYNLMYYRNHSRFIHGPGNSKSDFHTDIEKCIHMLNLLYCIYEPNTKFIDTYEIEKINNLTMYYYYICKKIENKLMRFKGIIKEVTTKKSYSSLILGINEENKSNEEIIYKEISLNFVPSKLRVDPKNYIDHPVEVFCVADSRKNDNVISKQYLFIKEIITIPS